LFEKYKTCAFDSKHIHVKGSAKNMKFVWSKSLWLWAYFAIAAIYLPSWRWYVWGRRNRWIEIMYVLKFSRVWNQEKMQGLKSEKS